MLILDYIYVTLKPFHVLLGKGKTLTKVNKICKFFSKLNSCLHYQIFIHLHIAYKQIHLSPGSNTSVKYTQLLVKFCLIV